MASATTCRLVRISPFSSRTTPEPRPPSVLPLVLTTRVWISTTEGRTASKTWAAMAGGGVTDASACWIASFTSSEVMRGAPGCKVVQAKSSTKVSTTPAAICARLVSNGRETRKRRGVGLGSGLGSGFGSGGRKYIGHISNSMKSHGQSTGSIAESRRSVKSLLRCPVIFSLRLRSQEHLNRLAYFFRCFHEHEVPAVGDVDPLRLRPQRPDFGFIGRWQDAGAGAVNHQ